MDGNFIVVGNIGNDLEAFEKRVPEFLNYSPTLMLVTGNVAGGSDESYRKAYGVLERVHKRYGLAVEVTPGEGDRVDGKLPETYRGYFGEPKASFLWNGLKFITVDSSSGSIDSKQLEFLEKQLIVPSFVFTHFPPDQGLWKFEALKSGTDSFLGVLAERANLVLGCFFGRIKTFHQEKLTANGMILNFPAFVVGNTGTEAFEISQFGYSRPGKYGGLAVMMKNGRPTFEPIFPEVKV